MQNEEGQMALLKKSQTVGKINSFLSLYEQSLSKGKTFVLPYTSLLPTGRDNMLEYLGACEVSANKFLDRVVIEQCSLFLLKDDNYTM